MEGTRHSEPVPHGSRPRVDDPEPLAVWLGAGSALYVLRQSGANNSVVGQMLHLALASNLLTRGVWQ
jgi:hypothetical protein